jgi:hypothetical protein
MEACDPADVLRRAAELASQVNADIAVAPGVLLPVAEDAVPASQLVPLPPAPDTTAIAETIAAIPRAEVAEHDDVQPAAPGLLVGLVRVSGARLAVGVAGASALLAAACAGFRERWEQSQVGTAQVRARRQAILLELTRRRLEASQRAVDLEGVRRAAEVALLQQDDADWPPASPLPRSPGRAGNARIWRIPTRQAALAGTALLAACFAVGLVVATFRPRHTGSSGPGVTVQGVAAKTAATLPQEAKPKPTLPPRPSPVLRKPAPKTTAQAHRNKHSVPRQHDDEVASDVVVRHLAPPKPTPRAQAGGWKHFSDTSN